MVFLSQLSLFGSYIPGMASTVATLPLPEFVFAEGPAGPALVVSAGAAAVVDAAGAGEAEAPGPAGDAAVAEVCGEGM